MTIFFEYMSEENGLELKDELKATADDADFGDSEPSNILKSAGETDLTYQLKWAAWRWLYSEAGCRAIGMEVRLEGPFGRVVDLVGVGKNNIVYIVEVKSSRSDLKRDDKSETDRKRAIAQLTALQDAANLTATVLNNARQHAVETTGSGTDWRQHPAYVSALRDHEDIENRLAAKERTLAHFSTKFHDPSFLACADFHYIMAPQDLITRSELPAFWGLLNERSETVVSAVQKQIRKNTIHVLRAIAKANTRDLMKACDIRIAKSTPE